MKKIILCFTALLLLFTACKPPEDKPCKIYRPKDLRPIDWENYNDVYTVYWNYRTVNFDINDKIEQDRGKNIMIYGWVHFGDFSNIHGFGLRESFNSGLTCNVGADVIQIDSINYLHEQLQTKLDTSDWTRKCFIKGKLSSVEFPDNCNWRYPKVIITDINDIYFE